MRASARRDAVALTLALLAGWAASARAQPATPDAGAFRWEVDGDEPPEALFARVKERIDRYCKGLGEQGVRDYYRISFGAHELFKERMGLPAKEPRELYERYLTRLCKRMTAAHPAIGPAFPYPELELFMIDSTTELCDLGGGTPRAELSAQLASDDPRLGVVRRLCKDAAIFASDPEVMRRSFASALLDELCLDPDAERAEGSFPVPEARRSALPGTCEARERTGADDLALLRALWEPQGSDGDGDDDADAEAAATDHVGGTALYVGTAALGLLALLALWRRRRAR